MALLQIGSSGSIKPQYGGPSLTDLLNKYRDDIMGYDVDRNKQAFEYLKNMDAIKKANAGSVTQALSSNANRGTALSSNYAKDRSNIAREYNSQLAEQNVENQQFLNSDRIGRADSVIDFNNMLGELGIKHSDINAANADEINAANAEISSGSAALKQALLQQLQGVKGEANQDLSRLGHGNLDLAGNFDQYADIYQKLIDQGTQGDLGVLSDLLGQIPGSPAPFESGGAGFSPMGGMGGGFAPFTPYGSGGGYTPWSSGGGPTRSADDQQTMEVLEKLAGSFSGSGFDIFNQKPTEMPSFDSAMQAVLGNIQSGIDSLGSTPATMKESLSRLLGATPKDSISSEPVPGMFNAPTNTSRDSNDDDVVPGMFKARSSSSSSGSSGSSSSSLSRLLSPSKSGSSSKSVPGMFKPKASSRSKTELKKKKAALAKKKALAAKKRKKKINKAERGNKYGRRKRKKFKGKRRGKG